MILCFYSYGQMIFVFYLLNEIYKLEFRGELFIQVIEDFFVIIPMVKFPLFFSH